MSSTNYSSLVSVREVSVDGVPSWNWIAQDYGAFDGPKQDWEESHKAIYEKHVTDWDTVIQAGGNCGMYPTLFSKMFKTVYTFEPDPLNFYTLVMNCQYDNIIKMQAALGEVHDMIEVRRAAMTNVGMHTVISATNARIPQLRIDDLKLQACGLIQLDIEGYEIFALRGARETIRQFRPVIACENGNAQIAELLAEYGYQVVDRSKMDTIYKKVD